MSRHDAMRKVYEADPEAYEWRWKESGWEWSEWLTPEHGAPNWWGDMEYGIRQRDGMPEHIQFPEMSAEAKARAKERIRESRENRRDGMPNALHSGYEFRSNMAHPPRPEDVFDPEKSPDHAPRWLVIGGGPQEYYSRESALQTAEEWSRSDPGRTYLIAKVEAICETQPPVFSVREL